MADVHTHVLAGFIVGTLLSFRYDWLGPEHVTLVMIGALAPDFIKINILISDAAVTALLGIPFSWAPLHQLGGAVLVILLGSLLPAPEYRTRAFALFAIGVATHFVLDWLLLTATGYAFPVFWPLTEWRPPAGNLYLSSDRWPALVAGMLAVGVWYVRVRVWGEPAVEAR